MVRVTGGIYKGRIIKTISGINTRPTPAIVREALFNIIKEVEGARFLDLYAGFGCVGIEALSRGASYCTFVEKSVVASKIIKENIKNLNLLDKSSVMTLKATTAIKILSQKRTYFDFIFLDPPFEDNPFEELTKQLLLSEVLTFPSTLIIKHYKKVIPKIYNELKIEKVYNYGDNSITLIKRKQL